MLKVGSCTSYEYSFKFFFCIFLCSVDKVVFCCCCSESVVAEKNNIENFGFSYIYFPCTNNNLEFQLKK